jgi:hypothetical protein
VRPVIDTPGYLLALVVTLFKAQEWEQATALTAAVQEPPGYRFVDQGDTGNQARRTQRSPQAVVSRHVLASASQLRHRAARRWSVPDSGAIRHAAKRKRSPQTYRRATEFAELPSQSELVPTASAFSSVPCQAGQPMPVEWCAQWLFRPSSARSARE